MNFAAVDWAEFSVQVVITFAPASPPVGFSSRGAAVVCGSAIVFCLSLYAWGQNPQVSGPVSNEPLQLLAEKQEGGTTETKNRDSNTPLPPESPNNQQGDERPSISPESRKSARILDATEDQSILWGDAVDGLRLGIRLGPFAKRKSPLRHGDRIEYEVWIKNESDELVRIPRDPRDLQNPSVTKDQSINIIGQLGWTSFDLPLKVLDESELVLPPGHSALRFLSPYHWTTIREPEAEYGSGGRDPIKIEPGSYSVFAEHDGRRSGVEQIDILPVADFQVRRAFQATEEQREFAANNASAEVFEWQDNTGRKQAAIVNWNDGVLLDEHDVAAIEVRRAEEGAERYSIHLKLREASVAWFASQTKSLAAMQEPSLLLMLLDGKPLIAPRLNSTIPNGELVITGSFAKDEAEELAGKLREARNANWITSPQICVGKAWSSSAKAANWTWDEANHVMLANADSRAMFTSCVPGKEADFVLRLKLRFEGDAGCRLILGDRVFDLTLSGEKIKLKVGGTGQVFDNIEDDDGWVNLTVQRRNQILSVQVNEYLVEDLGTVTDAIDRVSLESVRGTIAVSNFVITGDIHPTVLVPSASIEVKDEIPVLKPDEIQIEGQVVNAHRQPIPGAAISFLAFEGDEEHQFAPIYVQSNEEGRFSERVPSRFFRVNIGTPSEQYESLREFHVRDGRAVTPWKGVVATSDTRKITVTGTLDDTYQLQYDVIDSTSNQPIDDCVVLYKEDEATWYEGEESYYDNDANWIPFQIVSGGDAVFQGVTSQILGQAHIMVAARGYEPVLFKMNETLKRGEAVSKQVRMQRVPSVEFILTSPSGEPAVGVTIETLKSRELRAMRNVQGGYLLEPLLNVDAMPDENGMTRFDCPAFVEWTTFRIENREGYVDVRGKDLPRVANSTSPRRRTIRLTPFASIHGTYLPEIKPNEFLELYRLHANRMSVDSSDTAVVIDGNSRFKVGQLRAGWYSFVHRVRHIDGGTTAIAIYGPYELETNQTLELRLGGDGQSVVGRVTFPEDFARDAKKLSVSVSAGRSPAYPQPPQGLDSRAELAWWNDYWSSAEGLQYREYMCRDFRTAISSDQSFHFPSLLPGKYKLSVDELVPPGVQSSLATIEFEVQGDRQESKIDLGELDVPVE